MSQAVRKEEGLYLEDLSIGQRFTSGTYYVDEANIKAFASEFDPQPFHLDPAAARSTIFDGLAASGWHTAAIVMRLLVTGGLPLGNGIIGLGGELAWPKPTRRAARCMWKARFSKLSPKAPNRIRAWSKCEAQR